MLLMRDYHLLAQQVENQKWYDAVGSSIRQLARTMNSSDRYFLKLKLDYQQERRTAAMLQTIPEIVNLEYQQGGIKGKEALFTIGLSHLGQIIKCLQDGEIRVCPAFSGSDENEDFVAGLNLLRENFGVSIILPRALATDPKILEINKLDKVIKRTTQQNPTPQGNDFPLRSIQ